MSREVQEPGKYKNSGRYKPEKVRRSDGVLATVWKSITKGFSKKEKTALANATAALANDSKQQPVAGEVDQLGDMELLRQSIQNREREEEERKNEAEREEQRRAEEKRMRLEKKIQDLVESAVEVGDYASKRSEWVFGEGLRGTVVMRPETFETENNRINRDRSIWMAKMRGEITFREGEEELTLDVAYVFYEESISWPDGGEINRPRPSVVFTHPLAEERKNKDGSLEKSVKTPEELLALWERVRTARAGESAPASS